MVCTAGSSGVRRPPWEVLPWRRPIVQRPSADCEDDPEPGTRTSRKKGLAQGAAIRRHHQSPCPPGGCAPAARAAPARSAGRPSTRAAAPRHVKRLIDRLVADAHGLVSREVDPQAPGDLPRAPRLGPPAGAADVRAGGPSRPRPAQPQRPRPGWRLRQTGAPAHTSAGPRWSQAWPSSGVGPPARHATARCWPDTPAHRCAWRRCGATRARSWTPHAPAGERSPVCPGPVRDTARSPRVQRTPDTAPMAASLMAQVSSVACRPPPGTSGPPPRATRRPLSPRPRSTDPPQSPPRTAAGSPAAPRLVGQAIPATRLVAPDPSAVSQPSSQPPPSRCCDDHLNPPPYTIVAMRNWLAERDEWLGGCTFRAVYDRVRVTFEKM